MKKIIPTLATAGLLLVLLLVVIPEQERRLLDPGRSARISWLKDRCPKWMVKHSVRIVDDVSASCSAHRAPDGFKDVFLASLFPESGFDPMSTDGKGSHGVAQVQVKTAGIILKRKVTASELSFDIEMNIDVGIQHLLDVKSIQAYNAGVERMKSGAGNMHARKVIKALQSMPWVTKSRSGVPAWKYLKWFDFKCQKKKEPAKVIKKKKAKPTATRPTVWMIEKPLFLGQFDYPGRRFSLSR